MARLRSQAIGKDRVLQTLRAMRARALDLRPFWRDVFGPRYFASVQDVFALEGQRRRSGTGRFLTGHWPALQPAYAAWKARYFPTARILEREGTLRESLRWTGQGVGPGGVFEALQREVRFGTTVPYAVYHQRGTRSMPARPFLDPPDPAVFGPLLKQWVQAGTVSTNGV